MRRRPLVDAVVATEGAAAIGEDFELAPAAEGEGYWGQGARRRGWCGRREGCGWGACLFRIGRDRRVGDDEMGSSWL